MVTKRKAKTLPLIGSYKPLLIVEEAGQVDAGKTLTILLLQKGKTLQLRSILRISGWMIKAKRSKMVTFCYEKFGFPYHNKEAYTC